MVKEKTVLPRGEKLTPSQSLGRTKNFQKLLERPSHSTMPSNRDCKQQVYEKAAKECKEAGISGNYIGLAGSYMSEIFSTYHKHGRLIQGKAITVENSIQDQYFFNLAKYTARLNATFRYRTYKTYFDIIQGGIFEVLGTFGDSDQGLTATEEDALRSNNLTQKDILDLVEKARFSIIDLDMMTNIRNETIAGFAIKGVDKAATKRSQLLIWCPIGRNMGTNKEYETKTRPMLVDLISEHFHIENHTTDYYIEHVIPMHVDRFILTKGERNVR